MECWADPWWYVEWKKILISWTGQGTKCFWLYHSYGIWSRIWGYIRAPKVPQITKKHQTLEKIGHFGWVLVLFGTFGAQIDSRRPMKDYFIFETLNQVFNNDNFDSIYGWYGSNAQSMWKNSNFCYFWWFLGPLEPGYDPICYSRRLFSL